MRSIYHQLNNKTWLEEQYINKKRSLSSIMLEIGCKSSNSVRQSLLHFNINVRNPSEGLRINNPEPKIDYDKIIGSLLGDGSLGKYNKNSKKSIAFFRKRNIYYNHIKYIASSVYDNYDTHISKEYKKDKFICFTFQSFSHEKFEELYQKWYPEKSNRIKIIPRDLIITSGVLLNWFLDDGSSYYRKRMYNGIKQIREKQVKIQLCTDCFTYEDQLFLSNQINDNFDLKSIVTPYCKTYRIQIPQSKSQDFFKVIGECPIKEFDYKWKVFGE